MKKLCFVVLMAVIAFSTPAIAASLSVDDSDRDDGIEVGAGTKAKPSSLPDIMPNALKVKAPKVHAPKVQAPKVHAPKVQAPKVHAPKVQAPKPPKIKPPKP